MVRDEVGIEDEVDSEDIPIVLMRLVIPMSLSQPSGAGGEGEDRIRIERNHTG